MSATLQAEKFAAFFACPAYYIPGKLFPIEIINHDYITPDNYHSTPYCSKAIDVVMDIHANKPFGEFL